MEMIQNVCSEIKWLFHDDQILMERMNEYNEMHLDQDPNFMTVRNVILTAFPDFTWETHCNHERCETTALVTWRGIYKGYNDEYGNNSFKIRISLSRSISHWRNRKNQKDYGDVYVLKARFDRKEETLPSVVEKIKRDYDGISIINNYYEDEATRIFKVSCADHRHIAEKNVKLENFIKAVCEYRSRLVNKFVDADKELRLTYDKAQSALDIEAMELPAELNEVAKKYILPEVETRQEGESRIFKLYVRSSCYIKVRAFGSKAIVSIFCPEESTMSDVYLFSSLVKTFNNVKTTWEYDIGDPMIIKLVDMICKSYFDLLSVSTSVARALAKF